MEILRAAEEGAAGSYRNLNAGWFRFVQHGLASVFGKDLRGTAAALPL